MSDLKNRILSKEARLAVVGLGYVGLPLAVEFTRAGYRVFGIDVDPRKIESLKEGRSYVLDVRDVDLQAMLDSGRLSVHNEYKVVSEADCISICVPTPLRKTKDPDISYILAAARNIRSYIHPDMLVILESTTYPGTTDEILVSELADEHFEIGRNLFIAFSPERVDPGNPQFNTRNTPKIVGGVTPGCTEVARILYEQAIDTVIPVSSAATAEMVKLLENTFRAVNIGLVNEVAIMCDKLGVPVWEVIQAAATKPFGFMPFYPGPGLGGHCIPIDPLYLSWKLKTLNYTARFIELASEVNTKMPEYCAGKITRALNRQSKCTNGARILFLGVAYKKDISDVRESPALDMMRLLESDGAKVEYSDPYVPELELDGVPLTSVPIDARRLSEYDLVALVTDHACFDYEMIEKSAKLIFDSRNAFKSNAGHIVRL